MSQRLHMKLTDVIADPRYQARVEMDSDVVADYAAHMRAKAVFPAIKVIRLAEDGRYYIVDGFHRHAAAQRAKMNTIEVEVIKTDGTHTDILLECIKANHTHGLRRTNADKQRAVEMILIEKETNPALADFGSLRIAKLANVSKPMVIDCIRKRKGETTSWERKKQSGAQGRQDVGGGVESTTSTKDTSGLTKTQKTVMEHMKAAGIAQHLIDETLKRWSDENSQRKAAQRSRRKTDIERLEALADKLARSKNVVIEVAVKEATSRTKQYVKLPNSLKR